jgi:hypothetical protein
MLSGRRSIWRDRCPDARKLDSNAIYKAPRNGAIL